MTIKNGDMPASPSMKGNSFGKAANTTFHPEGGLTKREQFAMAAMQGFCADGGMDPQKIPQGAVEVADALLKELENQND